MKTFRFLLVGALLLGTGRAPAGAQHRAPDFNLVRYRENYAYLAADSLFPTRTTWERLKFIPLTAQRSAYLSVGGEIRQQYELVNNNNWGEGPEDNSGYLLQRYMLHADLHLGPHVRVFGQLKSGLAPGKAGGPEPPDEDRLDLHQAFFDVALPTAPDQALTLRVGRQELAYGSSRLVSVREGPNVRQSFDAVKAFYQLPAHQVDVFLSRPVQTNRGPFDDNADATRAFWGFYSVHRLPALPRASLDVYYLGLRNERARFQEGAGDERRHSVGTRLWSGGGPFAYNLEGVYQFGELGERRIRAYTASANVGYAWTGGPRWRPFVDLKAEIISGDQRAGDNHLQTFNPLFPKGAYFSQIAIIGPANLVDVHPLVGVRPFPALRVSVDADFFWRHRRADALYTAPYVLARPGNETQSRHIGYQYTLEVEWALNDFVAFEGFLTYFAAGQFLRESDAGRDITFFAPRLTLRF
ncbi:alginate export family protein [Hymenobacter sp.]|uniref:alginate export family protein n=1 Tax=Hymenobacter sp. TaxID=1898978 RepID=UPI00286D008F|nr:alginate export family protein [Hymenobacter sp.]